MTDLIAQGIVLTAPISDQTYPEGDDYFSTVMNNPMDFNERRGFWWEKHFNESTMDQTPNGIWSAATNNTGALLFPVFQGFDPDQNLGYNGVNYPIDPSKYTLYSSSSTYGARSNYELGWSDSPGNLSSYNSTNKVQIPSYYPLGNNWACHDAGAEHINLIDLSSNTNWTSLAEVNGIRIAPSIQAPAGTSIEYDWIRLCDPNSAPLMPITWTTTAYAWTNSLGKDRMVHIYLDSNNSGFNGAFIARVPYQDGSYSLPTAILPPGDHYFYLEVYDNSIANPGCNFSPVNCMTNDCEDLLLASSGYSAKISINAKPIIEFIDPSYTSGEDYATAVLGNPWDMNDAADIIFTENVSGNTFTGGVFSGTNTSSDSKVKFNIDPANPIDTDKYRYLTYDIETENTLNQNINDRFGWVARFIWWESAGTIIGGSVASHNRVYEGRMEYSIDLHRPLSELVDQTATAVANNGWQYHSTIDHLRYDPLEAVVNHEFFIYDVKLTAVPEFQSGSYTLSFTTEDLEGDSGSIEFFYDSDNKGFNGSSIGTMNVSFDASHSYTIPGSSIPNGEYYIYAVMNDGFNTHSVYTYVPIYNYNVPNYCASANTINLSAAFNGEHRAIEIESNGSVGSSNMAELYGETSVTLNSGFCVTPGQTFIAEIKSCTTP